VYEGQQFLTGCAGAAISAGCRLRLDTSMLRSQQHPGERRRNPGVETYLEPGVVKTSVTHLGQHMGNTFVPSWLLFLFLIPPKGESDLRMFLGLRFRSRAVPKRGSADTSRSAERQFAARVVAPGTRFGAPGFGTDRPFMRPPGWRPTPSAQSSASVPPVAPTATGQTTRCVYLPRPAPILPTIPPALQK